MPAELWGVITTYKRPDQLRRTLAALAAQTRPLDHLVVVDNGGDIGDHLNEDMSGACISGQAIVLTQNENLGPAGAVSVAMEYVAQRAGLEDWLVTLDDDDPPLFADDLERLWKAASVLYDRDSNCGAVGANGGRFDARRTRVHRLSDVELTGDLVPITTIGGGQLPFIRLAAIRDVGPYCADLFFGHEELEFFLRVQQNGWNAYVDTSLLRRNRSATKRMRLKVRPSRQLGPPDWRRYYDIRNRVYIAREHGGVAATLRLVATIGAKIIFNMPKSPRLALRHVALASRACAHGISGQLGKTVVPRLSTDGRLPVGNGKTTPQSST